VRIEDQVNPEQMASVHGSTSSPRTDFRGSPQTELGSSPRTENTRPTLPWSKRPARSPDAAQRNPGGFDATTANWIWATLIRSPPFVVSSSNH